MSQSRLAQLLIAGLTLGTLATGAKAFELSSPDIRDGAPCSVT
jgi:hypothetical protein